MDANRLIAEVYKRPALWNQRHISYHNREVTNRVWMEIAAIFNLPSTCRKQPRPRGGTRGTPSREIARLLLLARTPRHNALPRRPAVLRPCVTHTLARFFLFRSQGWERLVRRDRGRTISLTASRQVTRDVATTRLLSMIKPRGRLSESSRGNVRFKIFIFGLNSTRIFVHPLTNGWRERELCLS